MEPKIEYIMFFEASDWYVWESYRHEDRIYCLREVEVTHKHTYQFSPLPDNLNYFLNPNLFYSFFYECDFKKLKKFYISKEKFEMLWGLYNERD
jgi:hypothetical protein